VRIPNFQGRRRVLRAGSWVPFLGRSDLPDLVYFLFVFPGRESFPSWRESLLSPGLPTNFVIRQRPRLILSFLHEVEGQVPFRPIFYLPTPPFEGSF